MLSFSSATGNLFNRIGAALFGIKQTEIFQGTTIPGFIADAEAQYIANPELIPTIQASMTKAQSASSSVKSDISTIITNTLTAMVQADVPQPSATVAYAMPELILQMVAAPATVKKNIVSATSTSGGSNIGNGTCIVSLVNGSGITLENVFAETIVITCTQDSLPGSGVTAGQEVFVAKGEPVVSKLDFSWPGGSGGSTSITAASAAVGGSTANAVTNGNFSSFTSNTPVNWTITTGTAGTTVLSSSTAYIGPMALSIVGNGTELTKLTQNLRSVSGGVSGTIAPLTKYVLAFYVRVSSVPSAGVLKVSLQDGSGTTVGGGSVSVTLSGATTSYALKTVVLTTPLNLPSTLNAVIELTTALDNTKSVLIDELVITQMVQHQNGPFFAIIPGSTNFVRGDTFTVAVANDYGGKFQTYFNRIFNMDTLGLVLPSAISGSETISDSLIA